MTTPSIDISLAGQLATVCLLVCRIPAGRQISILNEHINLYDSYKVYSSVTSTVENKGGLPLSDEEFEKKGQKKNKKQTHTQQEYHGTGPLYSGQYTM
jgi:hypothetical protein